MVDKVNDNWDLTGQGIGNMTHVVDASGAASVEAAIKEFQLRHVVVGVNGSFLALQGDETPAVGVGVAEAGSAAEGCSLVVSFPA